jgi:type II secretory pathway component PulF
MHPFLWLLLVAEPSQPTWLELGSGACAYLLYCLVPLAVLGLALYLTLYLPLKRCQRSEILLDILEHGHQSGLDPVQTILQASRTRDAQLGLPFHHLAAHLENHLSLASALKNVPGLMPSKMVAFFRIAEETGEWQHVYPACRILLRDRMSRIRSEESFALAGTTIVNPCLFMTAFSLHYTLPTLREIAKSLKPSDTLPLLLASNYASAIFWVAGSVCAGVMVFYVLATMLNSLAEDLPEAVTSAVVHRLFYRFPWHRDRTWRDFSALLSLLLDAHVPESRAVSLAAQASGNLWFAKRAQGVIAALADGVALTEAMRKLDAADEFHWRLANAARSGSSFGRSIAGWLESLDARAFQAEQWATQLVTAGLVLLNGLMMGLIAFWLYWLIVNINS